MTSLSEKIQRARESRVPHGKHVFVVRRPTELQVSKWLSRRDAVELLDYVVDWEGVTEGDLVNGGDPHPVPFDHAALVEWASDCSDLFAALTGAVLQAWEQHREAKSAAVKN